jgi:dihydrolipoamide dehydrogenase
MNKTTQLAVIGAGPGGYTAAFRAADLGVQVTLIDPRPQPGGVCLTEGCIPSKALLHAARLITDGRESSLCGITWEGPSLDIDKLRAWKDGTVKKLTGGLSQLVKARNISYVQGHARFLNSVSLEITGIDGKKNMLDFQKAVIATGSRPLTLDFLPACSRLWDAAEALKVPGVPPTMLIIGGRYIGLELATAYAGLGSKVTVVEALPEFLSGTDPDLAGIVIRRMKKNMAAMLPGTKVVSGQEVASGIEVILEDQNGTRSTQTFDTVLTAVGRKPNTDAIGITSTKARLNESGHIDTDAQRRTDDENIFAIGDVTGSPMLAHKASAEGRVAAEAAAGHSTAFTPACIPAVVFTDPELAWAGLTETEARKKNLNISVSAFPWAACGRAMTMNRPDGLTKIIADKKNGHILGIGIAGVNAGDLIAEGVLAIQAKATVKDLSLAIHPHPTLSETLMEAAEGILGPSTHIFKPKK